MIARQVLLVHIWLALWMVFFAANVMLFPTPAFSDSRFTPEERAWLDQNPDKLVLWFNTSFPPIEFANESEDFVGIGADVITLIEKQLGIQFTIVPSHDWNAHLAALQSGECAVAPTIVSTPEREGYAQFTDPYVTVPIVIITAKGSRGRLKLRDLKGKRVAVVSGYATETFLRQHPNLDIEIVPMSDVTRGLRATAFGQVDAFVENLAVAAYFIEQEGISNLKVAGDTPYTFPITIGISRKYPLLASAITKALMAMPQDEIEKIRDRWIHLQLSYGWSIETKRWAISIGVFASLLIISLALITYLLKQQLKSKIQSIKDAQHELKQSEEHFRTLFTSAPVPLAILNSEGEFTAINDALTSTLGYTLDDIPDLDHWWPLVYPDPEYRRQVKATWEEDVRQALGDDAPIPPAEFRVTCRNGSVLRVRFNVTVLENRTIVSMHEITTLREKEAALQSAMEQLRATLNATNDGIMVINKDMRIIEANHQLYDMWQISPEAQKTNNEAELRNLIQQQIKDPQSFQDAIETLCNNHSPGMFELSLLDGRTLEVYSAPVVLSGQETGRVWDYRDITDRKKAEEAIDFERKKLRSIFEVMSDVVLILGTDARVVEVAPTKTDLLLGSPEQMINRTLREIFPPGAADTIKAAIAKAVSKQATAFLDYELTIKGRPAWFAATISPMSPERVVLVARNITSRKQAENQLRQSEEKFARIFALAPDIIAITRMEDGMIIDINNGFEEITGWKRNEVIGKTSTEINFWADPSARQAMVRELRSGKDLLHQEIEFRHKNGSVRFGLFSARAIDLAEGLSLLFVLQDITEYKKLESERQKLQLQLLQSQKMEAIGTLAGGVAHDFNNMLGAIIGYAELALITVDPSDPMHTSFKKILDVAHRSSELTRQLLAFARKEIIEPKVIDINKSIDKLLIMLQRLIGENIELAWRPGEGPLNVVLDPSQLDQILANLCVNARDAIEYIGKISITTDSHVFDEQTCSFHPDCIPGAYVSLAISDTGCGIEKDILANIFEPFFTTKAQGKGTGLGLSTVYGIVRQNRAFITVYSEGDQGSTFSIYFPKSSSEEDSVKSTPPEVLHSRGETVLLVEDDPVVLEMAQTMLKHLGYNVLSTGSPTEALTIAQRNQGKIDILLTDVVMPEVTGRELVDKLNKTNPEIKPLFMSGYTADMIANQGVLEEGITFLQKPFSLQSLSTKIRSVLDQQR